MWILAKILRLPSLKKGHTVDGRNVAPVWHLCIYQTPLSIRILFFHNHQSHIWLITTEISQVPHTNNLFKGTSSTRKGRVFFWLRPIRNKLRGAIGPISPLLKTSCQANCLCHSNWGMLTFLVNVHTRWMLQQRMSWRLNVALIRPRCVDCCLEIAYMVDKTLLTCPNQPKNPQKYGKNASFQSVFEANNGLGSSVQIPLISICALIAWSNIPPPGTLAFVGSHMIIFCFQKKGSWPKCS